jgi:hypothetical protein
MLLFLRTSSRCSTSICATRSAVIPFEVASATEESHNLVPDHFCGALEVELELEQKHRDEAAR